MSTEDIPAIISLRQVLYAFSVHCPHIGYCQSLNYIAGMLLLFLDEEQAFWMLVTIIEDILPDGIYDITMEGANIDQTVLMMFMWERLPHIWNKISSGKGFWECEKDVDGATMPTITLVTSHWFLTLFINILPTEVSMDRLVCSFVKRFLNTLVTLLFDSRYYVFGIACSSKCNHGYSTYLHTVLHTL
jgi:hypothetical protein